MAEHDTHTNVASTQRNDEIKRRHETEKAALQKRQAAQRGVMDEAKPTPTQEENDLAALGLPVDLEPDGSPEEGKPPEPPPEGGGGEGEGGVGATKGRETKPTPGPATRGSYSTRVEQPATTTKHE